MTLLEPERLWLLSLVAVAAGAYVLLQRTRRHHALRFSNLHLLEGVTLSRPGWRRHLTAGVTLLAAAVLVVALAEPVVRRDVPTDQAIVVVAMDVSLSMEATDVPPSRLAAARTAASEFVAALPPRVQVGVVAYGGSAQLVIAPTTDHAQAVAAIGRLRTTDGTAAGDALAASLDAIVTTLEDAGVVVDDPGDGTDAGSGTPVGAPDARPGPLPATVVLLSDGASADGRPVPAVAERAAALGVPVSTITYGTPQGTVLLDGEVVAVPPDPATMAAVAEATGGIAFSASSGGELAAVYDDLRAQVGTVTRDQEVTVAVVALGLVLLLAGYALGLLWSGRVL